MIIPTGVNHRDFYKAAKPKGIKITSRYVGVTLSNPDNKYIYWVAKCKINGKSKHLGSFVFSEQGELKASQAYKRYIENNACRRRHLVKRKRSLRLDHIEKQQILINKNKNVMNEQKFAKQHERWQTRISIGIQS